VSLWLPAIAVWLGLLVELIVWWLVGRPARRELLAELQRHRAAMLHVEGKIGELVERDAPTTGEHAVARLQ
jgi:hypothetical protein